ncbi:MAG: alpha/beta fold hydrolase, partial [Bacteroidales bacterium]|nr:alpha/beta fold hydrolase [Bacteroidales bacterium]
MPQKLNILFIHGIVGNSDIFNFLLPHIPPHHNVRFLNLAGHGSDALAFSRTSMKEWRHQVAEAVEEMSASGPLAVVAHSMGCLLALEQTDKGKIDRLFLLNPPMRIHVRWQMIANAFKVMTRRHQTDPVATAARKAYGISLDPNPLHYYGWPARYLELFRYISKIRKLTPHLPHPSYAFLAAHDEMVSPTSQKWFTPHPSLTSPTPHPIATPPHPITTLLLPTSTHYYYSPTDQTLLTRHLTH